MKKIILYIAVCMIQMIVVAQIWGPDGGPVLGTGLGSHVAVDVTPDPEIADTWEPVAMEGDRSVVWVHGLGGNGDAASSDESNSWIQASSVSDVNYQMQSRRPDYSDVSLDAAATTLRSQLEDYELSNDAYVIAHSQGGIVSRQLDKYIDDLSWDRTFGGVVTFGTPHGGATILNNRDAMEEWIGHMCSDLSSGPYLDKLDDSFFFSVLNMFTGIEEWNDLACDLLVESVLPFVFDLDAYYAGVTDGYYVGSPELEELNDYTPDVPYVAFWGEETEPVLWNTMVHMVPGRSPNSEFYGPFGATNDGYLADNAESLTNLYYGKYLAHQEVYEFWSALDFFPPLTWAADLFANQAEDIMNGYYEGYEWLVYANDHWKAIIGANEYVVADEALCYCVNLVVGGLPAELYTVETGATCDEDWGYCLYFELYDVIEKVNDGVVLKESASYTPNMISSKRMDGSNHFSMRNDEQTDLRLTELYDGEHGLYFSIDPR
jgi:pimeloyl-ACP methyl ester carboxylesterase